MYIAFYLQESEIVEVLWKQDVDLGYTLAPVKTNTPEESTNVSGPSFSTEDNEKLKALQELKNEKVCIACRVMKLTNKKNIMKITPK